MSQFQNAGTFDAGVFTSSMTGISNNTFTMDEAGIASGGAFLRSELEKRDPLIRKPLSSFTYPRDITINVGGGWADSVSAMSVAYGITGGNGAVHAGGANGVPIVSASVDNGIYKAHLFAAALRVMFVDMQRANYIGRSLDQLLTDGVRMAYDKHMDQNVYIGLEEYGTTGLLNNPDAEETIVATGTGGSTKWTDKTPDEILGDVNAALIETWEAAGYDTSAMPNHILLPYEQYTSLLTRKVTDLASKTILDFLMENNAAAKNGGHVFIGATRWCKGAGTDGMDRMVVYNNDQRFVTMDELVPLSKIMTGPNTANVCYDTAYMANISEVQVMYPQTIR